MPHPFRRRSPDHHAPAHDDTQLTEATQEDWFWGRLNSTGSEEDRYWRRLTDNWAQKDVLPATYLDLHNQVYEAYNANPLANAIVEMGVNFVLGDGLMVAMGAGLPEHYLSDGGDVNRATAAEMGLPVVKKYQRRQDFLGYLLRHILDRVILEGQNAGRIPRTVDRTYEIRFPSLQPEDAAVKGEAAFSMARALQIVRDLDLVTPEDATKLFMGVLGEG